MDRRRAAVLSVVAALLMSAPGCAFEGGDEAVKTKKSGGEGLVRPPAVAGTFYPGDAAELAADVDRYLASARVPTIEGDIVGIIAPHAGYVYSGGVAAHAYACLAGRSYDTVIVVAPSHRFGFRGASVYGGDGYRTPLGTVPVDRELADAVRDEAKGFRYEPRADAAEHSLEVQVPFLQRTLGTFSIVPIIMGDQDEATVRSLAGQIAQAVRAREGKKRVLLVASSDLSHYHPYDQAVALDSIVERDVNSFDPESLLASIEGGECEACGAGPMAAVMMAARALGADRASVVKYANSGDVTGDRSQVVGYMAAVLSKPKRPRGEGDAGSGGASGGSDLKPYQGLNDGEKRALLRLARASIEAALGGAREPQPGDVTDALATPCGAFVTLSEDGGLRGCIGMTRASKPLWRTVSEMAVEAALHDPRFSPVSEDELSGIDIEISVLSPLTQVGDVSEIEVGRDGLVIQDGFRSGLLLPQVATEYGWGLTTFLEHTCLKAGLPPDTWRREGVTILKFTAEVFGEKELGSAGSAPDVPGGRR
jgi:AmmeMemoRadiSam system protein B/AmmeMemoRadiSam system protein A